eukprot:COSAG04_NODE_5271_length_1678_cov_1.362888_2_plen_183_part_00
MVAAQLFLNACPFAACVFIMFFGRMFSHVLRAFMVWLVVLSPLLGYITLKGTSVTRIVLDGQEADLEVTATFLVAVLWCLMSVSCVVYTAIKMARFGKAIQPSLAGTNTSVLKKRRFFDVFFRRSYSGTLQYHGEIRGALRVLRGVRPWGSARWGFGGQRTPRPPRSDIPCRSRGHARHATL